MPYTKAIQFPHPPDKSQFSGKIIYDEKNYEYKIFFTPLVKDTPDYDYVVTHISKRRKKGSRKACLGLTKSVISKHLDNQITSAYVFVNEQGSQETASGSAQIYRWNVDQSQYQVWINDLCRNTPRGVVKSAQSPVKPLFHIFEQMAAHLLGKSEIYLMVETKEESVLVPLYEKYGFSVDNDFQATTTEKYIIMKKMIMPLPEYSGFPMKGGRKSQKQIRSGRKTRKQHQK
jgi:hypothetical protein